MASQINWRKVGGLFEIRQDPLTCFQITPDKGVTNTQNYKFFKDIAELERDGILKNLIQQSFKDGFRIVYKVSTDYIWYEILMKKDEDRKSTRLNSSHVKISYAVFCLKKK